MLMLSSSNRWISRGTCTQRASPPDRGGKLAATGRCTQPEHSGSRRAHLRSAVPLRTCKNKQGGASPPPAGTKQQPPHCSARAQTLPGPPHFSSPPDPETPASGTLMQSEAEKRAKGSEDSSPRRHGDGASLEKVWDAPRPTDRL